MTEAEIRLPPRETMDFDVVIAAGPAGLSAAIRLKQLAQFRSLSSKKAPNSAPIFCPARSSTA
jgi:flavin-dependent dehydrogenase